ncbi:MAG: tyrosine-protein phosphatase [Lachnospiraceae bacterium]|nr:tyrosine-protein phosphatase [Candidatus Merdinaster equi]
MKKIRRIANVRDLGGITCADGKTVVYGRLLRGGYLNKIKPSDAAKFKNDWKVSGVIDLRSQSEVTEKKDIIPDGVKYMFYPSLSDEQNPSINKINRKGILRKITALKGGAIEHLSVNYRAMISQEMSREAHRNMLNYLAEDNEGACFFHCTQGKDRTGVASAIILMALGAGEESIVGDYLNETLWLRVKNRILCFLAGIGMRSMKCGKNLHALMNAKEPCLRAALDEMKKLYGDADNYLREGIGISDEKIKRLREIYLV